MPTVTHTAPFTLRLMMTSQPGYEMYDYRMEVYAGQAVEGREQIREFGGSTGR